MTTAPAEPGQPAPEPGQPAPGPAPVAAPAAARSRVLVLRGVIGLALAVVAAILAILLYRHGVQQWSFGPVPPEKTTMTDVPRYIGPWMVAAAGALLAAGLLLVSAGSDGFRLVVSRRATHLPGAATG